MEETKTIRPRYRYGLRARITSSGFRSLTKFAGAAGVNITKISRAVTGWEIPNPGLQKKFRELLNLSASDFEKLL